MSTGGPPIPYGAQPPGPPYWGPSAPPYPGAQPGGTGPYPVTDEQLRRLPPPSYPPSVSVPGPGAASVAGVYGRAERPVVIGLATTLAVTASLLWLAGLTLGWAVAAAASEALLRSGDTGVTFHVLDSFADRMLDGLAVPLLLFPLASLVTGFLLLKRRPWTRLVHSGVGVLALAWAGWWLRHSLLEWGSVALYVGVAVGVLWTPAASRWYARRS